MPLLRATVLALAVLAAGCAAAPSLKTAAHEGVSFTYRAADFDGVEVKQRRKLTAQEIGDGIDEGIAPAHFCFHLKARHPLPALEQGPRYFFPAPSFVCAIPLQDDSVADFGETYPGLPRSAARLRTLLRERPAQAALRGAFPDLPPNNAGRSFLSRFQYLEFRSGSGIAFLTQYSQEIEPNPVNNEELMLVFQGLTDDGRYYVAARLAITHPSLPRGIDFTDAIERDRQWRYLKQGEKDLDRLPEDSFRPPLSALKDLLSSLSVGPAQP